MQSYKIAFKGRYKNIVCGERPGGENADKIQIIISDISKN